MNIKPSSGQHSALYTELNELNKIRQKAKDDNPEALRQVAQQFEQLFMSMLMKSMREANAAFGKDNFLNSSEVQFYEEMLDNQMTMELAGQGRGMGLADVLVKQLSRQTGITPDQKGEADNKEQTFELSQAERMLNRAFDSTGNIAASAVLGQSATPRTEPQPEEQQPTVPASLKPVTAVTEPAIPAVPVQAANQPVRFDTPEQFIDALMPVAESIAGELGVDPKVLLAQAALETGWGRHVIQHGDGQGSYNLFNIKADSRWQGDRAAASTLEFRNGLPQRETAAFRAYDSYEASFRDYVDFLKGSPRYQQALEAVADPYDYLRQLQQAGYATDPQYAEKISSILDGDLLASASGRDDRG